jgi:hypothetical protein
MGGRQPISSEFTRMWSCCIDASLIWAVSLDLL